MLCALYAFSVQIFQKFWFFFFALCKSKNAKSVLEKLENFSEGK